MSSLLENILSYIKPSHLIVILVVVLVLVAIMSSVLKFHIQKYSTRNMKIQSMQLLYLGGLGLLTLLALVFLAFSL